MDLMSSELTFKKKKIYVKLLDFVQHLFLFWFANSHKT